MSYIYSSIHSSISRNIIQKIHHHPHTTRIVCMLSPHFLTFFTSSLYLGDKILRDITETVQLRHDQELRRAELIQRANDLQSLVKEKREKINRVFLHFSILLSPCRPYWFHVFHFFALCLYVQNLGCFLLESTYFSGERERVIPCMLPIRGRNLSFTYCLL